MIFLYNPFILAFGRKRKDFTKCAYFFLPELGQTELYTLV